MHVLSSAPPGSAWTFGGSILTFALPMILTIAVGGALWVLYTKPELVPGRPVGDVERPVSYTPVPHQPAVAAAPAPAAATARAAPEDSMAATTADSAAATTEDAATAPEDSTTASAGDDPASVPEHDEGATSGDGE